jgi:hypothetical protein
MVDAAGFCCYGTVDSLGVCGGWDASGQIAVSVTAADAAAASAAAVSAYLGITQDAIHPVAAFSRWSSSCVILVHLRCRQSLTNTLYNINISSFMLTTGLL